MTRRRQEDPSSEDVWEAVARAVPGARLVRADEADNPFLVRRPTGVLTLDVKTGGGFPAGGITELWGPEGAGKNLLINCALAQNQYIHGERSRVVLVCVEYMFDKDYGRSCGFQVASTDAEIRAMEAGRGEAFTEEELEELRAQVGEVMIVQAATAEHALEVVSQVVAQDYAQLIVIDSVASMLVLDEDERALTDPGMSSTALPRTMARWSRKLGSAFYAQPNNRPNLTSIVITNQIMDKIGAQAVPGRPRPVDVKGGHALKHGKLLALRLRQGQRIMSSKNRVGHQIHWEVSKGKAGCGTGATGEFSFFYGEEGYTFGPDFKEEALKALIQCGLLERRGTANYEMESLGISARGKASLFTKLEEHNPFWYFDMYREVMRHHGIHACTSWAEVS